MRSQVAEWHPHNVSDVRAAVQGYGRIARDVVVAERRPHTMADRGGPRTNGATVDGTGTLKKIWDECRLVIKHSLVTVSNVAMGTREQKAAIRPQTARVHQPPPAQGVCARYNRSGSEAHGLADMAECHGRVPATTAGGIDVRSNGLGSIPTLDERGNEYSLPQTRPHIQPRETVTATSSDVSSSASQYH